MDSSDTGAYKLERARMSRRSRIRKVAGFLRVVELLVVLVVISRLSAQVPFTVKNSGEYFRGLKVVLVSPVFVFVVGNAIVVTLFTKSGRFGARDPAVKMDCFYEECAEKSRTSQNQEVDAHRGIKDYRRARSEKFRHKDRKLSRALHRLETKNRTKSFDSGEKSEKTSLAEDAMSSEEFRRMVEDFIAQQQKFRMEEEHHHPTSSLFGD